jgi:manganese/zinc/iron transport system substrate-binding protein
MAEIFERLEDRKATIAVAESISVDRLRQPPEFEGQFDPHVWFDVSLWNPVVREIQAELASLDPGSAALYQSNADAYVAQLEQLDAWAAEQIRTIPEASRVLITAHDAFGYFGARYGMEVRGLQGTSTATEAGAADVRDLAEYIAEREIAAIFVESSVPQATIEAVEEAVQARGWQVEIGGQLFSDAMGAAGTPEGTYIGMVRYNVRTIATALGGTVRE